MAAGARNYGSVVIQCDTATVTGATGTDSDIVDLALAFFGDCNVSGLPRQCRAGGTARWPVHG